MNTVPRNGLIDVHQHFLSPRQLDDERRNAAIGHVAPQDRILGWTPERALATMDRNGISYALGSISTPGVWFGDRAAANDRAREWNDYAAGLTARFPDRFGFFATIPIPAHDDALREIERACGNLMATGVQAFTNYDGRYLGDPSFGPILEELNRRGTTVFVHPTAPAYAAPLPDLMPQIMEFAFETARTIVSLLLAGATVKYPNIRWIFSHSGGALPILADRLNRLLIQPAHAEAMPGGLKRALQAFYFDSTGLNSKAHAEFVGSIVPISQILYGSDAPFVDPSNGIKALNACDFATADFARIGSGTMRALMSANAAL